MQVIKVVNEKGSKLVSTFATRAWEKEYAQGVETKPGTGYLFAYSRRDLKRARKDIGAGPFQYWLAEAKVVGRIKDLDIYLFTREWYSFWKGFKLRLRLEEAEYLLCSSITLIKRLT